MATMQKDNIMTEDLPQKESTISKQSVRQRRLWPWKVADCMLCLLVFFPSMVFYWRGIWELLGVYIYPGNEPLCHWVITGIGSCTILSYGMYPVLERTLENSNKTVYVIVTRIFMFIQGELSMTFWRGVWLVGDYYLIQFEWIGAVIGLFLCYGLLAVFGCCRSCIFPPFFVCLDTREDVLAVTTRLGTKINRREPIGVFVYLMDSCLTQFLIITLAALSWRHGFCIIDTVLYPGQPLLSDVSSFGIGVIMTVVFFALEQFLANVGHHMKLSSYPQWLQRSYEVVLVTFAFVTCLFVWRGLWNLTVTYFITDPLLGGWVNHVTGTVLLMVLQLFSYASACGCTFDGVEQAQGVIFDKRYLRHYLRNWIEHKNVKVHSNPDDSVKVEELNRLNKDESHALTPSNTITINPSVTFKTIQAGHTDNLVNEKNNQAKSELKNDDVINFKYKDISSMRISEANWAAQVEPLMSTNL